MVYKGESYKHGLFGGTPILGNLQINEPTNEIELVSTLTIPLILRSCTRFTSIIGFSCRVLYALFRYDRLGKI